jgi:hypothetical protein
MAWRDRGHIRPRHARSIVGRIAVTMMEAMMIPIRHIPDPDHRRDHDGDHCRNHDGDHR